MQIQSFAEAPAAFLGVPNGYRNVTFFEFFRETSRQGDAAGEHPARASE